MRDHMLPSEGLPGIRQNLPGSEANAGMRSSLAGDRAYAVISSRLRGYPKAQLLSREIYHFYGDTLSYIEGADLSSSLYVIELGHHPVALKNVEIWLQLGTGRVAEALTHELLHLHLPMLGFPLGESVEVPLHLDPYAQHYLSMCNWVVNVVHHEIIFQKFLTLGFQERYFLAELTGPLHDGKRFKPIPQNGAAKEVDTFGGAEPGFLNQGEKGRSGSTLNIPRASDRGVEWVDFSRWCIEYVRYLSTARHGGNKDCLRYAQDALDRGSQVHRDLTQTAAKIDAWFEAGAFKDPHQYPRQVNLLLDLVRIPGFTGWVVLNPSEHMKPMALRLGPERISRAICKGYDDSKPITYELRGTK